MKKYIKIPEALMAEARQCKVAYTTRLEIQRKAQENGTDFTTPAAVKYTAMLVQAGIDYDTSWAQIYDECQRDGWDPNTCGDVAVNWYSGFANYDTRPSISDEGTAEPTEAVDGEAAASE